MSCQSPTVSVRLAVVLAALAAALLVAPSASAQQSKFAVIDLRRAVFDTEDGLRVQAKLQQLLDARQADFEGKKKSYEDSQAELERLIKDGKLGDAELRKKAATLEKMAFELQAAQVNYRREVQREENELMTPIIKQMMALVRRLASQHSYDMVLSKEAVPYVRADLDITDRIIQMYNAQTSTSPDAGPPGKAPASKRAPEKSKPKAPRASK
jgi:outer membrane protein